jgi:hypothetical protein
MVCEMDSALAYDRRVRSEADIESRRANGHINIELFALVRADAIFREARNLTLS